MANSKETKKIASKSPKSPKSPERLGKPSNKSPGFVEASKRCLHGEEFDLFV